MWIFGKRLKSLEKRVGSIEEKIDGLIKQSSEKEISCRVEKYLQEHILNSTEGNPPHAETQEGLDRQPNYLPLSSSHTAV